MMRLEIISPKGTVVQTEVTQVSLPGAVGAFTVLNGHAPIISTLRKGNISYQTSTKPGDVAIEKGMVEVKENIIRIFVEQFIQTKSDDQS
jgi:F-type H+-transporting ATPase subunit epsilon